MFEESDQKYEDVMECFAGHATETQLDLRRGAKFRKAFREELSQFSTEVLTKAARKVRKGLSLNSSNNLWAMLREECEKLVPPVRSTERARHGCDWCNDGVVCVDNEPNLVVACPMCDAGCAYDAAIMRDRETLANIANRRDRATEKANVRATLMRVRATAEAAGFAGWWRPSGDPGAPRARGTAIRDNASAAANDRSMDEVGTIDEDAF